MTKNNNPIQMAVQDLAKAAYYKLGQIIEQIEATCEIKPLIPLLRFITEYEQEQEANMSKYPYAGDVCLYPDPCQSCGEIDCICDLRAEDDLAAI